MKITALKHMILEEITQLIDEGVYDKNILKAIWLAGGPASGKSYVTSYIFGMMDETGHTISKSINPYGLKILNSDTAFEFLLKRANVDMKTLEHMSDQVFKKYTEGDASERARAKKITEQLLKYYSDGRLGMILDSTAAKSDKVSKQKQMLEKLGYDTYMLFVSTDLDVALMRNKTRDRVLPPKLVEMDWNNAQVNSNMYKSMFGSNYFEIANNKVGIPDKSMTKMILRCINSSVNNPIGKQWIQDELNLRKKAMEMK